VGFEKEMKIELKVFQFRQGALCFSVTWNYLLLGQIYLIGPSLINIFSNDNNYDKIKNLGTAILTSETIFSSLKLSFEFYEVMSDMC